MNQEIWVLMEVGRNGVDDSAYGLLVEADAWRSQLPGDADIVGLVLGSEVDEQLDNAGLGLADRILHIENPVLDRYQGDLYSRLLADLFVKVRPSAFLMSDNDRTRDLAARLSAGVDATLLTRVIELKREPEGSVKAIRPVSNGFLFEEVACSDGGPLIVSFLPSVLGGAQPDVSGTPVLEKIKPELGVENDSEKLLEIRQADPDKLMLEDADIIVAAGRGAGKEDGLAMVQELAETIGGSLGATRPVVDWGAIAFERQIGQTGKLVTPGLIINCGISGANEFTAGMEKARHIVSINTDPRARIFQFSDIGAVADLRELIPVLIRKIQARSGNDKQEQA